MAKIPDPLFDNATQMIATVLGMLPPIMDVMKHEHSADCARDCEGLYVALDLVGDGTDNDDLSASQFIDRIELPQSFRAAREALHINASADNSLLTDLRRAVRGAWEWHGKPESFVWHPRIVCIDGFSPSVDVVVVDQNLDFTMSGLSDLTTSFLRGYNQPELLISRIVDHLRLIDALMAGSHVWRLSVRAIDTILCEHSFTYN